MEQFLESNELTTILGKYWELKDGRNALLLNRMQEKYGLTETGWSEDQNLFAQTVLGNNFEQNREIHLNWTGQENFDIDCWVLLTAMTNI